MSEIVKFIEAKRKDRRIYIYFIKAGNDFYFDVRTKRLIDFKKRIITETHTTYSVETFQMLFQFFELMVNDYEVIKLKNPQMGFPNYTARTNLKTTNK